MNRMHIMFLICCLPCGKVWTQSHAQSLQSSIGIAFQNNYYRQAYPLVPGVSLSYNKPLDKAFSYSVSAAGAFLDSGLKRTKLEQKKLMIQMSAHLSRRVSKELSAAQFFVTAGSGISLYENKYGAFVASGAGVHVAVSKELILSGVMEYRPYFSRSFNSHAVLSVGISGLFGRKRRANVQTLSRRSFMQTSMNVDMKDSDQDGIDDDSDMCPFVAGIYNNKGCPITRVSITDINTSLDSLARLIFFESNSATLTTGSHLALRSVVQILQKYPTLMLRVEGHTDSIGTSEANTTLSSDRSRAVVAHLNSNGILLDRLVAFGLGESQPIMSNESPLGRAKNRRVELKVFEFK